MAYGNTQGVDDGLLLYAKLIDPAATGGPSVPAAVIGRFLQRATNLIDTKIAGIPGVVIPLSPVPGIIDDIAVDIAICLVLKRLSAGKDPNKTDYVKMYCEDPVALLDSLIEKNPGAITGGSSTTLMLSNTVGDDPEFSVSRKQDGTTVEDGTTEDW